MPTAPVSIAVALADKIDTLVGFWAIDEKPTGSKDPYALRRARLGVIRIILDNDLRLPLRPLLMDRRGRCWAMRISMRTPMTCSTSRASPIAWERSHPQSCPASHEFHRGRGGGGAGGRRLAGGRPCRRPAGLFGDRLKVHVRERGAVTIWWTRCSRLPGQDDLLLIVRRVDALQRFLETEDGRTLLAGYRRAVNILRIEEKKDGARYEGPAAAALLAEPAEERLAAAIETVKAEATQALKGGTSPAPWRRWPSSALRWTPSSRP